jgi:DNA-directed RNA polymerase specialized sigma24 family protein
VTTSYTLAFDPPVLTATGHPRTLTLAAGTPADLAQEVHRHARGTLGARNVDVRLDADQLTGTILRAHAPIAAFTLTPHPAAQGETTDGRRGRHGDPTLHGYTLDDLHHLSRYVVHSDRWHTAGDIEDRYDTAWHAIVEHLLTAPEPPTRHDLFQAGLRGSDQAVRQRLQAHGYNHHQPGTGTRPRFEGYWTTTAAPIPSPEDRVVDRHALAQIWPRLTPRQQQALTALAATDDYQQAAALLGVTPGTFNVLVSKARRRFLALWHEGEQPSHIWGTDRRVGSRTATTPAATKRRPPTRAVTRRTGRPQHKLVHGRASTYTNHACRCVPCTKAASAEAKQRNRANGATPRRRITVSQLADIRRRRTDGESVKAIAAELEFADTYLYRLLAGTRQPAPDPI